jgi:hypothetical protein
VDFVSALRRPHGGKIAGNRSPFYSPQDTETHSDPVLTSMLHQPLQQQARSQRKKEEQKGQKKQACSSTPLYVFSLNVVFFF